MEGLGTHLRREREFRQITLEEISSATKYNLRVLSALEEDKFETLPPPTYVRGLLRAYGHHIGLDIPDLLLRYEARLKGVDETPAVVDSQAVAKVQKPERNHSSILWILFLLGAGFLFFYLGLR